MSKPSVPIGELISQTKNILGVNQVGLARLMGLSKGYVSDLEKSQRHSSPMFAVRLYKLLEDYEGPGLAELRKKVKEHTQLI